MRIGFETEVQGNLELGYSWQSLIKQKSQEKETDIKDQRVFQGWHLSRKYTYFYLFIHFARCSVAFSLNDIL